MQLGDIREVARRCDPGAAAESFVLEALRIRLVEETFLELFAQGRMNGTVHTCVGQEFSAVAVCKRLADGDWVTSNHRCHGHFIAKTGNWRGLIDELMGLKSGVCQGVGSSQHLYAPGFLSNGIQGALLPVGTGIALYQKRQRMPSIVASFIGEGTLGEGAVYEALNLASVYQVPQLFVCENNFYSQSTPQSSTVAGDILARAQAFGIATFEANTWDVADLLRQAKNAIDYVRTGKPAFLRILTYRLNAHSKGDDDRAREEIDFFHEHDPLSILLRQDDWAARKAAFQQEIAAHIAIADPARLSRADYCKDQLPRPPAGELVPIANPDARMVQALNAAYAGTMSRGAFLIGEDVIDPYGGAFKVTKGLSTAFPEQVYASPISEAGLVGVAIGMALMGVPSYAEIMFGDFCTLAFDQLLNNASKMHHMYAFQATVPLRLRTPMGGKRGYGPTHSQSLEKHLVGIDNTLVLALSSLMDPAFAIKALDDVQGPAIIIENKLDYGKPLWKGSRFHETRRENKPFGGVLVSPSGIRPTLTVVSYGETARHIADNLEAFFEDTDQVVELVCLTQLHPLDLSLVRRSLAATRRILIVEDGSVSFGIGAEILSQLLESGTDIRFARRIGAAPYPIPSVSDLELNMLPTIDVIKQAFLQASGETAHD